MNENDQTTSSAATAGDLNTTVKTTAVSSRSTSVAQTSLTTTLSSHTTTVDAGHIEVYIGWYLHGV